MMIARNIPSLRQLRAFEAVARLESVSSAARELNLSQPGVTQAIRALEQRIDARLFDRRRSGCYVTELGAILVPRVQRLFERLRLALVDLGGPAWSGRQNLEGTVNRITQPQLRSLIAISENPSFDAAARSLKISEPSLHRSARELERELRRNLYRRTARGVTTTVLGSELARRFQVALREIIYGLEELEAARGNIVSRIAIGNIPHSATQILSKAVKELLSNYPGIRVQIVDGHYEDLLNDLRAGKLDLLFGVLRRPDWAVDVKEELLFANDYVVVARSGHPLCQIERPKLQNLARYDWIMPGPETPRQQALRRMLGSLPTRPRVSIETTSLQIYRTILAGTDQLTLMSRFEAQLNDAEALSVLPFRSPHLHRFDGIATRVDWRPTSVHLQFIAILRAQGSLAGELRSGAVSARKSGSGSDPMMASDGRRVRQNQRYS
jgi:LysR family transcriptional regulator, regulator for genes of the gallate degradation pathway